MLVLAIDTSSDYVVAGVVHELSLRAERSVLAPRGHGELLAPTVAQCLAEAGLAPADLTAIVAGVGPGPYTALRVGLVTAAALGDALGIATYGVCSLDAIADEVARDDGDVLVATDARRKEVYWARYDEYGRRRTGPHVGPPATVEIDDHVARIGGLGAAQYSDFWPDLLDEYEPGPPSPAALVEVAFERIRAGAPSEPLTPMYLRRPDAVVPGAPKRASQ